MSTFSAYGMGPKGFLVNRPLNDDEIANHLDVHRPASQRVHHDLSLTKLNSTFVECVDKWYSMRGFVALAGSGFGAAMLYAVGAGVHIFMNSNDWFFLAVAVVPSIGLWWMVRIFLSDAFTYTHYPIRFNRRNQQVYAFRRDGTVLKAGWEDFYWTIYNTKLGLGGGDLNVMGHLLGKDGITIQESIGLSLVDAGESGKQNILQCFEFLRRYMQEGPGPTLDALKPAPLVMLPGIDKTKESWFFGWQHLTNGMKGMPVLQVLFQPFLFPISLFRWIVMRTSKIPQWPQWVEDECRIDSDDPWIRDERHAAK